MVVIDSSAKTVSSTVTKDSNPEEEATPDSGSTRADWDGLSAGATSSQRDLQQKPLKVTYSVNSLV